jgi:hypothetical protein
MGKRKRDEDAEVPTAQEPLKSSLHVHIDRKVKKISDALQLASRFERQKLGRREKTARAKNDRTAILRVYQEIDAMKVRDALQEA